MSLLYEKFLSCRGVTTDTRTLQGGEMFFALKGENFDGNAYAMKALEAGAAYAVVDQGSAYDGASDRIIAVPDTLQALQDLARCHRERSQVRGERLTVIGLTGTNGKTTTKELIRRVLACKYKVTATEGNLNNDIGVPLSLLKITPETEIAVIEMGANHPDDIARLVSVAEPDYGLITNVGKAHLLGFGSFEGVQRAKGQLYDYIAEKGKAVFLNVDDPVLSAMAASRPGLSVIPYGIQHWNALVLPSDAQHPFLRMAVPEDVSDSDCLLGIETHLAGAYNANNVLAALAIGLYFGVSLDEAIQAVGEYVPANSRSQLAHSGSNVLILDAYNANPTSMAAALDNLAQVQSPRRAALLGDMRELGADSVKEHVAVLEKLSGMGLDCVCLVGEEFHKALSQCPIQAEWFATSEDLAKRLPALAFADTAILVKGSRGIQMEKVLTAFPLS